MGILPMSEGLTQTHGQDARATAGTPMLPSIGRSRLLGCVPVFEIADDGLPFLRVRTGARALLPATPPSGVPFPERIPWARLPAPRTTAGRHGDAWSGATDAFIARVPPRAGGSTVTLGAFRQKVRRARAPRTLPAAYGFSCSTSITLASCSVTRVLSRE